MQVMILDDDAGRRAAVAAILARAGHGVAAPATLEDAMDDARRGILDLLVLSERTGPRLTHPLALLADWRHPGVDAVLLSDRVGEAREDLASLLPMVRRVLPAQAAAGTVAGAALDLARLEEGGGLTERPALPPPADLLRSRRAAPDGAAALTA